MPGTFIFKPLQANLLYNQDVLKNMDPYCKIKIGRHGVKSSIASNEGIHPHWEDTLVLERKNDESFFYIKLKDKDTLTPDDDIGQAKICLEPIEAKGRLIQWYSLYNNDRLAGEILLDISYDPNTPTSK